MSCANWTASDGQQLQVANVNWVAPLVTACCAASMLGSCCLAVCVHLRRKTRAVKAIGQLVMNQVLLGTCCQLLSHLITVWLTGPAGCHASSWLFHMGNLLIYADIGLHCWRLAVIMDFGRLRRMQVSDAQVMKRFGGLVLVWTVALAALTALTLAGHLRRFGVSGNCFHGWVDACLGLGHLVTILWALWQAFGSRVAPDCYNTSLKCALCLYNFAIGLPVTYAVLLLIHNSGISGDLAKLVTFVYSLCVVSTVQVAFILQQLLQIRSGYEEISIPVSEITGGSATHRVDVCLNHNGKVVSMRCVPCGQLVLSPFHNQQASSQHTDTRVDMRADTTRAGDSQGDEGQTATVEVFKGYTEEEFDRLVDMFQQLKTENMHLCKRLETLRCAQRASSISSGTSTTGGGGFRRRPPMFLNAFGGGGGGGGADGDAGLWESSDTLNTALTSTCGDFSAAYCSDENLAGAASTPTSASTSSAIHMRRSTMPKSVSFPTDPTGGGGGGGRGNGQMLPAIPERCQHSSREQFF